MPDVRRVNERLYISDEVCMAPGTSAVLNATGVLKDGIDTSVYRVCRVDLGKEVYGAATAFGKAVSWLGQVLCEGETVTVCGSRAHYVVGAHLQRAGFSKEEADTLVGEGSSEDTLE
jgi:hypothetical protein